MSTAWLRFVFLGLLAVGLLLESHQSSDGGDEVHILSGVHGSPQGGIRADIRILNEDVEAYAQLKGVHVYDMSVMTPEQVLNVVTSPGTVIGATCHSEIVLQNLVASAL